MVKAWKDIKKEHLSNEEIEKSREWAEKKVLEMNLQALRKLIGKTQEELAEAVKMAQGELSKVERRRDHLVSTLRKYVEALGGKLEIAARFDDKIIRLKGV